MQIFADNLQQFMSLSRKAAGLTQEGAGLKLHVSTGTIGNYENGRTQPDFRTVAAMAKAYRIPELLDYYIESYRKGGREAA